MCWVLTPFIQHGDLFFIDISYFKCHIKHSFVVGKGQEFYLCCLESLFCYGETIGVAGYHANDFTTIVANGFYCFEGTDNGSVKAIRLDRNSSPQVSSYSNVLEAYMLAVDSFVEEDTDELYPDDRPVLIPYKATAIPYYTWGNRGETEMRVWMQ